MRGSVIRMRRCRVCVTSSWKKTGLIICHLQKENMFWKWRNEWNVCFSMGASSPRGWQYNNNVKPHLHGGNVRLEDTVYIDLLSPEEEEKYTLYNTHSRALFGYCRAFRRSSVFLRSECVWFQWKKNKQRENEKKKNPKQIKCEIGCIVWCQCTCSAHVWHCRRKNQVYLLIFLHQMVHPSPPPCCRATH